MRERREGGKKRRKKDKKDEPREIRTPNLQDWNLTRCHCAMGPYRSNDEFCAIFSVCILTVASIVWPLRELRHGYVGIRIHFTENTANSAIKRAIEVSKVQ